MGEAPRYRCEDLVKTSVLQPVPTSQTKKGHETRPHANCQVIGHNMILHVMKHLAVVDRRNEGVQLVPVETVKFCSDEMILTRHDKPCC